MNWLFYVTGPTFLYGDSDTPPHLVAFYDHAGDTELHILDLTARALTGGGYYTPRTRKGYICRPTEADDVG